MSRARNQDFLRGSDQQQARVVGTAALVLIAIVAVFVISAVWVYPQVAPDDSLRLSIDVPDVAPGVPVGTKVILHGAEVGEVKELDRNPDGSVRMCLSLRPEDIRGLTDNFDLDFRPENYFGVTAVNLVGKPGGAKLVSGKVLDRTPKGDFTMSTMLQTGSLVVDGTLTKTMVDTMNKVIRYTDGLTPMIEAGIVIADRVAQTQQALPSELVGRMNDMIAEMPGFAREALMLLNNAYYSEFNHRQPDGTYAVNDAQMAEADAGMELSANKLFGLAGTLLKSHESNLTPIAGIVQSLSDAMPGLLAGGAAPEKVSTLIDRLNGAFSSGHGDTRTLNMRIVLDDFPGVAAPLALTGISQRPKVEVPR